MLEVDSEPASAIAVAGTHSAVGTAEIAVVAGTAETAAVAVGTAGTAAIAVKMALQVEPLGMALVAQQPALEALAVVLQVAELALQLVGLLAAPETALQAGLQAVLQAWLVL